MRGTDGDLNNGVVLREEPAVSTQRICYPWNHLSAAEFRSSEGRGGRLRGRW